MEYWQLPGPAAFVEQVAYAVGDGKNVLVAAPVTMSGILARVLDDRLGMNLSVVSRTVAGLGEPLDELYEELDIEDNIPPIRNPEAFIKGVGRACCVIVTGIEAPQAKAWAKFADEYERTCRNVPPSQRVQLVILTAGVAVVEFPPPAAALEILAWDGWVGEADVLSYIVQSWRKQGRRIDPEAKLTARIITQLALWDFDLVDKLMELGSARLFDPHTVFNGMNDNEQAVSFSHDWESGGVAQFDGETMAHSLLLAAEGDPKRELEMRLWAAQAAELLPVLELKRRSLLERMKATGQLRGDLVVNGELVKDLDGVELGGLAYLAGKHGLPRTIVAVAESLKNMRNKLSHLTPLSADQALKLLQLRIA